MRSKSGDADKSNENMNKNYYPNIKKMKPVQVERINIPRTKVLTTV